MRKQQIVEARKAHHAASEMNELSYLTNEELVAELKKGIGKTAHGIAHSARVWNEMERRGLDLSKYRVSLSYLPLVAAGKLLPEIVAEFMGDGNRLRLISTISQASQRHLLDTGMMPIYDAKTKTTRLVPLAQIDSKQIDLAVDHRNGVLRSPDQQQARLVIKQAKRDRRRPPQTMHLVIECALGERIRLAANAEELTVSAYLRKHLPLPAPPVPKPPVPKGG